jgi:hypothetical protein
MQAIYRSDYPGEFIVLETKWSGGKKIETREWIANPIENQHISGRAACIGSSTDADRFDYTRLQRHRGGLLGSKKLQTYGTGPIALKMRLDFTVETNAEQLKQLTNIQYQENNIVYTTSRNCISNPGEFYIVPHRPRLLDLALLLYISAFDGHQEIFLLGYNNDTPIDSADWINQIKLVIDTYTGIKFYLVGEKSNIPGSWLECANTQAMNYREFISYCDV